MGDQGGYNAFQKGETALGSGADQGYYDVYTISHLLEITVCDFKKVRRSALLSQ